VRFNLKKTLHKTGLVERLQGVGPEFNPTTTMQNKIIIIIIIIIIIKLPSLQLSKLR
jgi:hypothetical protein